MGRLIDEDDAIRIVEFECGKWTGLARTIINGIKKIPCSATDTNVGDTIYRQAAIDAVTSLCDVCNSGYCGDCRVSDFVGGKNARKVLEGLPSAQPEPDWDYSEETKQITLIVPEDVYDSAETIFLSVGYEGTFGIRGMVYSAQPERKKGWWLTSDDMYETGICSVCKCDSQEPVSYTITMFKYCPNCGADMKGEKNETN